MFLNTCVGFLHSIVLGDGQPKACTEHPSLCPVVLFKCLSFLSIVHLKPHGLALASFSLNGCNVSRESSYGFYRSFTSEGVKVCWWRQRISWLELAVAAHGDLWGGCSRSPALSLRAAVALWAARVLRGVGQQVRVMVALLKGALGGAFRGQEGGILLQPAEEQIRGVTEKSVCCLSLMAACFLADLETT